MISESRKKIKAVKENVGRVIVGKSEVIEYLFTALLAKGHILLEDVPGTGKTVLAKTFARSIGVDCNRIQFTADLLPSDITGLNIYHQKQETFLLKKGPVFTNILLADEINRAMPRTQSSLLECMEEYQVTVEGDTYQLDSPFLVIATENPVETAGTFPLPEAQLDRFMMKVPMGYPSEEEELEIVNRFFVSSPLDEITAVCQRQDIIKMQEEVRKVWVHPVLKQYAVYITRATRTQQETALGVSPRATLALIDAARAYAYIQGRNYVVPEDIWKLSIPVLAHRIILKPGGLTGTMSAQEVVGNILKTVPVPTEEWGV